MAETDPPSCEQEREQEREPNVAPAAQPGRRPPTLIDVDIDSIAEDGHGAGVAMIRRRGQGRGQEEAREVRVKGTRPGQQISARILKRRRGIWWGMPVDGPAADLQSAAPCPAFLHCGGCTMQQLQRSEQLLQKQVWLLKALDTQGVKVQTLAAPVVGPQLGYRRKARLGARYLADKDEYLLGFRESFGGRVARLDACPVLAEPFGSRVSELKLLFGRMQARALLPQIEIAAGDGHSSLALRHLEPLVAADRQLLGDFARSSGIQVLLQSGGYETLVRLDGDAELPLNYRLDEFGLSMEFRLSDFVQVNEVVNQRLVAAVSTLLRPVCGDQILELFCGIGNFSLPVARSGADVVGVEGSDQMVERARGNAQRNGMDSRTRFVASDLYAPRAGPADVESTFDKVLVDPPRGGCGHALRLLMAPRVQRVVYVSCGPHSFARDAAELAAAGFDLKRLGLFDMFPHTAHVETLALFERR